MNAQDKPKVLCVDDEPQVVSGLCLHLRRRYTPLTASSGAAGLDVLRHNPTTAVVISDMRMPVMDGATFLELARRCAPDTVRILLTGQADTESAVAAVNQGQVFRFLTKPAPPPVLMAAVDAAADQHRLLAAERVLLEQTLRGSLDAVTNVLSVTNPLAFGCATRVRHLVSELAMQLGWPLSWQADVAAMLCQLGAVSLPPETAERVYYGKELSSEEAQMVRRIPAINQELLASIPRIDVVLDILKRCSTPFEPLDSGSAQANAQRETAHRGTELLKAALDFDRLDTRGVSPQRAVAEMRTRRGHYDPAVLDALQKVRTRGNHAGGFREVPLSALTPGMVLADDLRSRGGVLLCARGSQVGAGLLQRLRNDDSITGLYVRVLTERPDTIQEAS